MCSAVVCGSRRCCAGLHWLRHAVSPQASTAKDECTCCVYSPSRAPPRPLTWTSTSEPSKIPTCSSVRASWAPKQRPPADVHVSFSSILNLARTWLKSMSTRPQPRYWNTRVPRPATVTKTKMARLAASAAVEAELKAAEESDDCTLSVGAKDSWARVSVDAKAAGCWSPQPGRAAQWTGGSATFQHRRWHTCRMCSTQWHRRSASSS
jgi:hypothetical protein